MLSKVLASLRSNDASASCASSHGVQASSASPSRPHPPSRLCQPYDLLTQGFSGGRKVFETPGYTGTLHGRTPLIPITDGASCPMSVTLASCSHALECLCHGLIQRHRA